MKKKGLLFSLILCALLSACGGKDESADALLAYYTLEGDTIPSIEQFINDETGGRLVATLSPDASGDTGEQNASDEADTQDTSDDTGDGETEGTGDTATTAETHNYTLLSEEGKKMAAVDILSDARRKKDERSKEICSSCTQCSNGIFHGRKRIRSSES